MAIEQNTNEQPKNQVEVPLEAYTDFMEVLEPINTLMLGTRGMRAAGRSYLPQEEEETNTSYNNRLNRSFLLNYFKRTLDKLAGSVFSKPVKPSEDFTEDIDVLLENIDNNGHDITQFTLDVFKDGIKNGITNILVDYPQVRLKEENGVKFFFDTKEEDPSRRWKPWTRENEVKLNFRPNWVHVKAEQVIGWRTELKQGKVMLTQVRIFEQTEEPDGQYGQKSVNRIRVFTPTTWEVHVQDDAGVFFLESAGTNNLGYIPLVSVYFGEKIQEMVTNPPLEGLSDINIAHWQSNSDQRNILHYSRFVIFFGKMMPDNITVGPNRFVMSEEPDSDLKIVEHSGAAIGAGRQDVIDLEKDMTMYGLTYMMPKTGTQTATERAMDSAENDSALKSWALSMEDGLNQAVQITADYMQIEKETAGKLFVNVDFSSFLAGTEAKILIEAKDKNIIPRQIVIDEFIRRGILSEDTDPVEIEAIMEKERTEAMAEFNALNVDQNRAFQQDSENNI